MKLTPSQAKLVTKARRFRKTQRIVSWVIVLVWPVWTYLAAMDTVPRLEIPVATVLFFLAGLHLIRPAIDADVLDALVSDDYEVLEPNA